MPLFIWFYPEESIALYKVGVKFGLSVDGLSRLVGLSVTGSWLLVAGSWLLVLGSWFRIKVSLSSK